MLGRSLEISRTYSIRKPPPSEWFDRAVVTIESDVPTPTYCFGTYSVKSKSGYRYTLHDWVKWKSEVLGAWRDISEFSCDRTGESVSIQFTYTSDFREARLQVRAPTAAEVEPVVKQLEEKLSLSESKVRYSRPSKEGIKRQYFTSTTIDHNWFESALATMQASVGEIIYFEGRFQTKVHPGTDYRNDDLLTWKRSVVENWRELVSFYIWLSASDRAMAFDCDVQRELVSLEVQAPTLSETERISTRIAEGLSLQAVEGTPYKYRRFARTFRIIAWKSNKPFADAISNAINSVFEKPPAVVDCYVTQGKGSEDLEPFDDLARFLARVADLGAEYDRATLYVQGAHGLDLGIHLNRTEGQLGLRSSMRRKEFNKVASLFEDKIDLKLLAELKPMTVEPDRTKKPDSFWGKIFLAIVPALVLTWGGIEGFKGYQKQYAVEIIFPRKVSTGNSIASGPDIKIDWVVQVTQWWNTRECNPVPDSVIRVFDESGSPVFEDRNKKPLVPVRLLPGVYTVEVEVSQFGKRDRVPVTIRQGPKSEKQLIGPE